MSSILEGKDASLTKGRFDYVLRLLMANFDVSQKEVADLSGVSLSFVNDLFHGRKQQLSIKRAEQISMAFPDDRINGTALFILSDRSENPLIMEIRRNLIRKLRLKE